MGAVHVKSQKGQAFAQMPISKAFVFWTDWPGFYWFGCHRKWVVSDSTIHSLWQLRFKLFFLRTAKTHLNYFIWNFWLLEKLYFTFTFAAPNDSAIVYKQKLIRILPHRKNVFEIITQQPPPSPPPPQNSSKHSRLNDERIHRISTTSLAIFRRFLRCFDSVVNWIGLAALSVFWISHLDSKQILYIQMDTHFLIWN